MRRLIPSPALIVACLVLLLAPGGVSHAAGTIGTRDLQRNAVTSAKIKNDTVDLGVRTFTFKAGKAHKPSNNVAFAIVVP